MLFLGNFEHEKLLQAVEKAASKGYLQCVKQLVPIILQSNKVHINLFFSLKITIGRSIQYCSFYYRCPLLRHSFLSL